MLRDLTSRTTLLLRGGQLASWSNVHAAPADPNGAHVPVHRRKDVRIGCSFPDMGGYVKYGSHVDIVIGTFKAQELQVD